MLHSSIDAYVQLNSELARDVCARDNTVDNLNRDVIDELERVMAAAAQQVPPALHLFSASRHVERVADHATNIAEDVVYLVEGEIIRHRSPSETSGG
jgi:phosphate transport system protein